MPAVANTEDGDGSKRSTSVTGGLSETKGVCSGEPGGSTYSGGTTGRHQYTSGWG